MEFLIIISILITSYIINFYFGDYKRASIKEVHSNVLSFLLKEQKNNNFSFYKLRVFMEDGLYIISFKIKFEDSLKLKNCLNNIKAIKQTIETNFPNSRVNIQLKSLI